MKAGKKKIDWKAIQEKMEAIRKEIEQEKRIVDPMAEQWGKAYLSRLNVKNF